MRETRQKANNIALKQNASRLFEMTCSLCFSHKPRGAPAPCDENMSSRKRPRPGGGGRRNATLSNVIRMSAHDHRVIRVTMCPPVGAINESGPRWERRGIRVVMAHRHGTGTGRHCGRCGLGSRSARFAIDLVHGATACHMDCLPLTPGFLSAQKTGIPWNICRYDRFKLFLLNVEYILLWTKWCCFGQRCFTLTRLEIAHAQGPRNVS